MLRAPGIVLKTDPQTSLYMLVQLLDIISPAYTSFRLEIVDDNPKSLSFKYLL